MLPGLDVILHLKKKDKEEHEDISVVLICVFLSVKSNKMSSEKVIKNITCITEHCVGSKFAIVVLAIPEHRSL